MRRRAFSLVELLTVIAIIAILAAILFPVFIQVRNYARQYVAGQAMMKLSTSTSMYLTDYDDVYPVAYYQIDHGRRQNWYGVLDKHGEVIPNTGLISPYIKGKIQPDASLDAMPWQGDDTGYGYNWGYLGSDFYIKGGRSNGLNCENAVVASNLGHPSDTIQYGTSIFYFAPWMRGGDSRNYRYGFIDPPKAWYGNPTLDFRHMGERKVDLRKHEVTSTGQALVVYADGHMKNVRRDKVTNDNFTREGGEWNIDPFSN